MTSQVKGLVWSVQMLKRSVSQCSVGGLIGGEKAFDAHFLQGNILRCSEGCNRTK